MRPRALRHLFGSLLWLASGITHAEGACPSGQYQASPPNHPLVCKSIPPTRWGAIAIDAPRGTVGSATDRSSKQDAEQAALANCQAKGGSSACKVQVAYGNGCAALVTGGAGYSAAADVTRAHAVETGMKTCNDAGHVQCHVAYSGCSAPPQMP
jgi:hypothetical protein